MDPRTKILKAIAIGVMYGLAVGICTRIWKF